MARANFVKKSRKDYPEDGIYRGESYWWWKFNFNRHVFRSKTRPSRSQLTQSSFLSQLYDIEDRLESCEAETFSDLENLRDDFVSDIESLLDEVRDSYENMPEHLRETSSSGQILEERISALEQWIDDLQSVDVDDPGDIKAEELEDKINEILDELKSTESGL